MASTPTGTPPATITVGRITIDDSAAYTASDPGGIWQDCFIVNHYEKDRHRYMAGVASPGGFQNSSTAFFQLSAPTLLWICDWMMERIGTVPQVPNPTPKDTNWVLLDDWWEPEVITIAGADGSTPRYRIRGTYVYGHKNPANNTNANVAYPLAPWIDVTKVQDSLRTIDNGVLTSSISDLKGASLVGITTNVPK